MLFNVLQYTGQPPSQRMIQPQMSIVLRLRNPGLKDTDAHAELLTVTQEGFHSSPTCKVLAWSTSFPTTKTLQLHFFDSRTKAQRGKGTGPRTHR